MIGTSGTDVGRLLAHIGMHKTGTTWFQRRFYPQVRNYRVVPRPDVRKVFVSTHAMLFEPRVSRALLRLDEPGNAIICEEALCGNPHTGGHRGAVQKDRLSRLQAVRPDATIVMFLRRQTDAIESLYAQYVRGGGTHGWSRYLYGDGQPDRIPRFAFEQYDYLRLHEYCASLFGADHVRCYLFEEFAADNRAFLERFARELQLDVDVPALSFERVNTAYTALGLHAARLINAFGRGSLDFKYYLINVPGARRLAPVVAAWLSRAIGGAPFRLPAVAAAAIADRYRSSNRELALRLGLDLARFGYPI